MNHRNDNDQPWAILLAGGDGKRLSALTRRITGDTTPKQFCPVIGNRTLLDQTRRRISLAIGEDRILTVLTRTHERFYRPVLSGIPSRNLVVQPHNRGTAPAILYALLRLAEEAPAARVALFPCDHFVDDDRKFMQHVGLAFEALRYRPELTVLLGITAGRPETSYGWMEPGETVAPGPVFAVRRFWEKPHEALARDLLRRHCLWNSFVMVAQVSSLLGLFMIALPGLYVAFRKVRATFGTVFEERTLERLYKDLPVSTFSDDVLMRHNANLGVLAVAGVQWSDLGDPQRVMETLNRLGAQPPWNAA